MDFLWNLFKTEIKQFLLLMRIQWRSADRRKLNFVPPCFLDSTSGKLDIFNDTTWRKQLKRMTLISVVDESCPRYGPAGDPRRNSGLWSDMIRMSIQIPAASCEIQINLPDRNHVSQWSPLMIPVIIRLTTNIHPWYHSRSNPDTNPCGY